MYNNLIEFGIPVKLVGLIKMLQIGRVIKVNITSIYM